MYNRTPTWRLSSKDSIILFAGNFFYPNHAHVSLLVTFVPSIYASAIGMCLQTVSLVLQTQPFLSRRPNHFQYPYLICDQWCHWNGRDLVCKLTCLQIKQKFTSCQDISLENNVFNVPEDAEALKHTIVASLQGGQNQTYFTNSTEGTIRGSIWKNQQPPKYSCMMPKPWIMVRHYARYRSTTNNKLTFFWYLRW